MDELALDSSAREIPYSIEKEAHVIEGSDIEEYHRYKVKGQKPDTKRAWVHDSILVRLSRKKPCPCL